MQDLLTVAQATKTATVTTDTAELLLRITGESWRGRARVGHHADVAPIGLYVSDYDSTHNAQPIRKSLKLLGHTAEQIATLNYMQLLALLHPDDHPRLLRYFSGFVDAQDGEVREFEYRVRQRDGSWNWFYSRDQVLARDKTGAVRQIVGVVIDLTSHQRREEALHASEEFNRSILESSADCIKVLDLDGKLLSMNQPGMCLMEVDDFAPFRGMNWSEFWSEEDQELARAALDKARRGEAAHFRGFCRTAKGTPKWWDVMVSPILNAAGQPQRLVSVSRDITRFMEAERALMESEKKLRLATIGAQLGLWFWNLETNELNWTEVGKKLFGLPPEAVITYERFLGCLHPDDRMRIEQAVRNSLAQKLEYNVEYRVVWPDQSVHWIAARGRGFYNEAGQAVQMMGTTRDVTSRKRVEEERERLLIRERELREQAEQANRVKEEFLSVVSHELRTPLNHMYGWIKLLRAGNLNPQETAHALEIIERNAAAQNRLIEDLLDMSRVMSGKLRLDIHQLEPAGVIRAAVEAARPAAEAKGIHLEIKLSAQAGQVDQTGGADLLSADPDRLQQVVWNLISNAIKFTPSGGRVTVELARADEQFEITVADTGQGIAPELLPFVFDRFRQADSSITRRQSGLGLGLAIVRHLVELHGGTVRADSPGLDQGATFRVALPALAIQTGSLSKPSDPAAKEAKEIDWESLPSLRGLKVLAVDDEADARHLIGSLLHLSGAEVRTANDLIEAQAVVENWHPDLLVSDIGMPNGSGYDLIRQIRQREKQAGSYLPAVALTAYGRPEDRLRALSAGFQMHVTKPVEPAELIAVLASLSGRFP